MIYFNQGDFLTFHLQTVVSSSTVQGAMEHVTVLGTRHVMLRQEYVQVDYVPRTMKDRRVMVSALPFFFYIMHCF